MKKLLSVITIFALSLTLASCGGTDSSESTISFTMSGSNSMEKLAKSLVEAYGENHDVNIEVQGTGSSAGVPNVVDGVSGIGMLSRELKSAEKEKNLKEYIVAIDGIAVAVHADNKVNNLTIEDLNKIYSRQITNWKDLGGDDMEIVVIGREASSGTRDGFESIVGLEDVKADSEFSETGAIIAAVKTTPGAVGYISTGYVENASKVVTVDGVEPTVSNIQDKSYPLQRNFIMVTKGDDEDVETFIEYVFSPEGQDVVEIAGSIPVK